MYTTLMGVTAGPALLLLAALGAALLRGKVVSLDGWALALGSTGILLTLTGLHMALTQFIKLKGEEFKNEFFGGLTAAFGVLLVAAAVYLWRRGERLLARTDLVDHLYAVTGPPAMIVFGLGLSLIAVTIGAFQYKIFATAPVQEPIFGTAGKGVSNAVLSSLFALPAIGATVGPIGVWLHNRPALVVSGVTIAVAGAGWTLTGATVFYTHMAMYFNFLAS